MVRTSPEKAVFRAEIRLTQDMRREFGLRHCPVLATAANVAAAFSDLAHLEREVLICATVDCKCRLIQWSMLAVGCADRVTMRLGDAFQDAIRHNARGVILVHNHPSGSLSISAEDLDLTQSVAEAGEMLGYTLLDHVILSQEGYRSVMAARRKLQLEGIQPTALSEKLEAAEYRSSKKHAHAGTT